MKPPGECLHCDVFRLINDGDYGKDKKIIHSLFEVMGDLCTGIDGTVDEPLLAFFKYQYEIILRDITTGQYKTEQTRGKGRAWNRGERDLQ